MKLKLKIKILILVLIVITIIGVILFITRNKFVGTWTTDGVTVYKFNKDNTGYLIVPLSEYKFTYKIKKNKLYIDFENETSEDSEYEYTFNKEKMILKGKYGTFEFTKKNEK